VESWHALHGVFERIRGQAAGSWELGAGKDREAWSREQRARSTEQGVKSRERRAKGGE